MREDFSKVLVERPRSGRRGERKGWRRIDRAVIEREPDSIPSFESSSRQRGGTKRLNEHLGPLRRFLRTSVGRHWNDVYAELSTHVHRGNAVQAHVFQHLYDYVERYVQRRDGRLYDRLGNELGRWRNMFYVCPESGVLKVIEHVPRWRRRRVQPSETVRMLDDGTAYRCIDGVWFRVWFATLPNATWIVDEVLGERLYVDYQTCHRLERVHGRRCVFAVRKEQLGKREIRRERLRAFAPSSQGCC